jgi:hypothetical protein
MPTADEIQAALLASWRLMQGRPEALQELDLSADGFWNSFFAMVVAFPALFAMWTGEAIDIAPGAAAFGARLGIVARLALVEAAVWIVPILAVAYCLVWMGRRDRVVAFVIANNWGTALLIWVALPVILLHSFAPSLADVALLLLLILFLASLVLFWRLNNAVLKMGYATATAALASMVILGLLLDYTLRIVLAIPQVTA